MVLKSNSVLSCLIPSRLTFGSNPKPGPDSPSSPRNQEKYPGDKLGAHNRLGDSDVDPFRGNSLPVHSGPLTDRPDLSRARANTAPSDLLSLPLVPNGGIGESPHPVLRSLTPQARPKRSSFTTFFAFSSKRRSTHGASIVLPKLQQDLLVPPQSVSGGGQSHVHLVNHASIPSPLRADDDEYYYSYYPSMSPADPLDRSPSKQLSVRQQHLTGNPDLDSRLSSPIDSHLSHTQIRHPYAYSTPLYSKPYPKPIGIAPHLRHVSSQPFHHHPQGSGSGLNAGSVRNGMPSSQLGHEASNSLPHLSQSELKTSMSTPNLLSGANPIRPRSCLTKKHSARSKERWLSTESWWNALFSPSPRFKVKQASPHPSPAVVNAPINKPVQGEPNRSLSVTFPSIPAARPRAASVTSPTPNLKPAVPSLLRSRSAVDLSGRPSTSAALPRVGFEPALETLVDQPTPPPDRPPSCEPELLLPDPPLSLEQVLDEGEAFEQQRAQWKKQASKSIGNKHIRSFSRARSKSLGEGQVRLGRHTAESSKSQMNFEFLAARTLLGSQSMMPVVHVSKPSGSSSYSKAYSHSHSQSAYSFTHSHSSHSRAYSHSHSHSLTTSNSSKSSRNHPPRAHSRNGSWGKTFLKAGALCGIGRDDSYIEDEKVPSPSRVDTQGTMLVGHSTHAQSGSGDAGKVSPMPNDPNGEVGIAISPSPPVEGSFNLVLRYQEGDQEKKHTHKSSDYAGPHPSAIDSNIPPLRGVNDVSLRHRLPPRAIHPPIAPIPHPYRSVAVQSGHVGDKGSQAATSKVAENQEACTGRTPHLSLSNPDFEQYGVGEALIYAALRRSQVPEAKPADVQSSSSPATELPSSQEQSPSCDTIGLHSDRDSSSVAVNSVPSLTSSTIQMVMSAFDNPDDFDEFQDLFYKPLPASHRQRREPSVPINQVPTDVQSSTSSSPLTHLVRKLSEEVQSLRNPSRAPSDPIILQRSESQDTSSDKSRTKFVFMNMARSSSPPPTESSSQLHVRIQEASDSATSPVSAVPEDVSSFYTSSVLGSPLEDHDNDTFGVPIKHGQLEAVVAPTPIQSPVRTSTHPSIEENEGETEDNEAALLSPVTRRFGLVSIDAVRASYITTSDLSRMSALSDFPLPPGARPVSILHAYSEAAPSSSSCSSDGRGQSDEETEICHQDRGAHGEGEADGTPTPIGDVEETLRALRMTPRITSYVSHRSTFGGSEDTDYVTELHQAGP